MGSHRGCHPGNAGKARRRRSARAAADRRGPEWQGTMIVEKPRCVNHPREFRNPLPRMRIHSSIDGMAPPDRFHRMAHSIGYGVKCSSIGHSGISATKKRPSIPWRPPARRPPTQGAPGAAPPFERPRTTGGSGPPRFVRPIPRPAGRRSGARPRCRHGRGEIRREVARDPPPLSRMYGNPGFRRSCRRSAPGVPGGSACRPVLLHSTAPARLNAEAICGNFSGCLKRA